MLILGVRGSGNSRIAHIVERLGWHRVVSDRQTGETDYAADPLSQANEAILRLADRNWADPKPMPAEWMANPDIIGAFEAVAEIIAKSFEQSSEIVIDDPRVSRLLPLWLPLLDSHNVAVKCLFPTRSLPALAQTLHRRAGVTEKHAMLLWESYFSDAEQHSRTLPRAIVSNEALVDNWQTTLAPMLSASIRSAEAENPGLSDEIGKIIEDYAARTVGERESPGEMIDIKPRIDALQALLQSGLHHEVEFDVYRERWVKEWADRSPGSDRSSFGDSLSRNLIAKSRALAEDQQLPAAIATAQEAIGADPENARYHFYLATLFSRNTMLAEAETAYRQAITLDASDSTFHEGLAKLLRDNGDISGAIHAAQSAIACAPNVAGTHFLLGNLFVHSEQIAEAEHAYRTAIALDPSDPRYSRAHADTLQRLGRIEEAIGSIQNAIKSAPGNSDYRLFFAKLSARVGDFDTAESAFAEALCIAPEATNIIEPYRDLLVRLGRDADAKTLTEKLVSLDPESVGAINHLSIHYLDLGDVNGATRTLAEAARISEAALQIDSADKLDNAFNHGQLGDEVDGATALQHLLTLLSVRRAKSLASIGIDQAPKKPLASAGQIWPFGTTAPEWIFESIARYGSLADRWNRLITAWRNPQISYRDQLEVRPAISVMIPVFEVGNADWLRTAIESVLGNTFDGDEIAITIVDDASTNGVAKSVVNEFGSPINYVRNERNLGIVGNHNQCIRLARGELVHILHQDDRLDSDFYSRVARPLIENSSIVASFSRATLISEDGTYRSDQSIARGSAGLVKDFSAKIALRQRIFFPSLIVRRSAYERVGGFAHSLVFAFDLEMWGRLAGIGPVWHDPEPLVDYRIHSESVTNSLTARTRLIDGMRAAYLNMDHLPAESRTDSLILSLHRLLRREWDRLTRGEGMSETDAAEEGLLDFLLADLVDPDHRARLMELISGIDRVSGIMR